MKSTLCLLVPCLLILVGTTWAQIRSPGKCPRLGSLPIQEDFDFSRYMGQWYSYSKTQGSPDARVKCTRQIFVNGIDDIDDIGPDDVDEQGWAGALAYTKLFDTRTEEYMDSRGTLLTVDNVYRARMAFSQNDNHGRVDARSDPNYNVIKTDYNNYAMVYSCEYDYSDKTKSEQILVLTREKQPSQEVIDSITEALRTQGLPNLPVTREAQDCPDSEFAFFSSLLKQ